MRLNRLGNRTGGRFEDRLATDAKELCQRGMMVYTVTQALQRPRQDSHEFKANLAYAMSSRLAWGA